MVGSGVSVMGTDGMRQSAVAMGQKRAAAPTSWAALSLAAYYFLLIVDNVALRGDRGQSGLVDEAFILGLGLFAVPALARLDRRVVAVLVPIILYFAFGFASALFNDLPAYPRYKAAVIAIVLDAKPFIALLAFCFLLRRPKPVESFHPLLQALVALALLNSLFVLRDMAGGGSNIYGEPLGIRIGMPLPTGIFHHQTDSVDMSLIGALAAGALFVGARKPVFFLPWAFLTLVTMGHLVAKELVVACVAAGFVVLQFRPRQRTVRWLVRSLAVCLIAVAAVPAIQFAAPVVGDRMAIYFGADWEQSVRTAMYARSGDIAVDFFPFGTGSGTYGSQPSRTLFFSPVYDLYGISSLWGGSPEFSSFLMDTFWPKVLGEAGIFGLLCYLAAFIYLCFKGVGNLRRHRDAMTLFCVLVLIAVTVKSVAAAVFTHEMFAPLIGFAGAYILTRKRRSGPEGAA